MGKWEDNVRRVVPYTPGEQPKKAHMIKLNTNENPYPPAPEAAEVLKSFDASDLRRYPDPAAQDLICAIADFCIGILQFLLFPNSTITVSPITSRTTP